MLGFGKAETLDRDATLRLAEEFRSRKKPKKAISELEKLIKADPRDAAAHAKLGPLLVQTGQQKRAIESFRIAANDLDTRGFAEKALSLWLQIAQTLIIDLGAWQKVAQFHASKGRKADGVKVLINAADLQEGKEGRARAVSLLRDVLLFDPRHLDGTLKLARLLVKDGHKDEARSLLDNALTFSAGPSLKRIRRTQLSLFPGFRTFWRWVRA